MLNLTSTSCSPVASRATTATVATPETIFAEALDLYKRGGLSQKSAEVLASEKRENHRREMLGKNYFITMNAAEFMATSLRAKRLPREVERWQAQQALEEWLPHMPQGERREILTILRHCTPIQLGPELAAIVANYSAT